VGASVGISFKGGTGSPDGETVGTSEGSSVGSAAGVSEGSTGEADGALEGSAGEAVGASEDSAGKADEALAGSSAGDSAEVAEGSVGAVWAVSGGQVSAGCSARAGPERVAKSAVIHSANSAQAILCVMRFFISSPHSLFCKGSTQIRLPCKIIPHFKKECTAFLRTDAGYIARRGGNAKGKKRRNAA
jgi:hypothetical protein